MILRVWSGLAIAEREGEYVKHFEGEVLPQLGKIDGFIGASLLRRVREDGVQITVHTRWISMDAIRKFASDDLTLAVVAAEARPVFHSFDQRVTHHEVVISAAR